MAWEKYIFKRFVWVFFVLLGIAVIVELFSALFLSRVIACGHFPSGTIIFPARARIPTDGPEGRTIQYSVGFCHYLRDSSGYFAPSHWNIYVGVDMPIDTDGRNGAYTLDDYRAAQSMAAAKVYEYELRPRFGELAAADRDRFMTHGFLRITQPAKVPLWSSVLLLGVLLITLVLLIRLVRSRRHRQRASRRVRAAVSSSATL